MQSFFSVLPVAVSIDVAVVAASAFIRYILGTGFHEKSYSFFFGMEFVAFTKCRQFTLSTMKVFFSTYVVHFVVVFLLFSQLFDCLDQESV